MLFLLCSLAFAIDINKSIEGFNLYSVFDIPILSERELIQLKKGELVKRLDDSVEKQPTRGIAYYLSSQPMTKLWIACQDEHLVAQESAQYLHLESFGKDRNNWYSFMKLPWPIDDRHWITTSWNNHQLAQQSQSKMWEHAWKLERGIQKYTALIHSAIERDHFTDIDKHMIEEAIFLPESKGAWGMIEVEEQTLVIYHATISVGGHLPADILAAFLLRSVDSMFKGVEVQAIQHVEQHYSTGHAPIYDGQGTPILPLTP